MRRKKSVTYQPDHSAGTFALFASPTPSAIASAYLVAISRFKQQLPHVTSHQQEPRLRLLVMLTQRLPTHIPTSQHRNPAIPTQTYQIPLKLPANACYTTILWPASSISLIKPTFAATFPVSFSTNTSLNPAALNPAPRPSMPD